MILAGVWSGPVKPQMEIILKPILNKIEEMNQMELLLRNPSVLPIVVAKKFSVHCVNSSYLP